MNKEVEKLKAILQLDTDLQRTQDLDILLEKILYDARRFVNADAGTIYQKKEDKLLFSYTQNETQERKLKSGQKLIYSVFAMDISRHSIAGYVAETKETLNIPNCYSIRNNVPYRFNPDPDRQSKYKTTSMLTVPLLTNMGEVLGVLQVINAKDDSGEVVRFSPDDELYIQHFAGSASMALQRAQLTRQLLLRMISMAELRDPTETGPHVNRVAAFAVEIYERWARRRKMPKRELHRNRDSLRMAAMLHDVGKVAISDTILKKPGRLTDGEYATMQTHAFRGARLFRSKQSEFDDIASMVALTHHERWDGTGYPGYIDIETGEPLDKDSKGRAQPRKGEEIPIFGRVVTLSDVYDALINPRSYKEAWKEDDVLRELKKGTGKTFDPELVDIFFEALPLLKNVIQRYPNPE